MNILTSSAFSIQCVSLIQLQTQTLPSLENMESSITVKH